MQQIYRHRVNTVEGLDTIDPRWGVEFDIRSDGDDILVTHDPFTQGPTLDEYLGHVGARPLLVNVKCEGIVPTALASLERAGVDQFFFLDLPVADRMRMKRAGRQEFAVPLSEMEPAAVARAWEGAAGWLWVDCWSRYPVDPEAWPELASHYRICVGSPELYGHAPDQFDQLTAPLEGVTVHAVCTKHPERWHPADQ